MSGPFCFAWAGGEIIDPVTVVTIGDLTEASTIVTDIPAEALAALTEGLRYNISGNGIPAGTTFVAPALGATEIALDQAPTAAQPAAILTLNGPRAANEPFDPAIHNRFDEDVLSITIEHGEGDFATLTVDIKNNGIGLLATGRNLWCWLSWDAAWTPDGTAPPDLVPLFNGRLVALPALAADEVISLQFVARPDDFNVQKLNVAEELKVLPFWDPVWLATNANNPDTVLESYSALWHTDRTTLAVTTSDIIEGEDGLVEIGEDEAFYDAFAMSFGDAPLRQVAVSGTVSWQQTGEGIIDVTPALISAFKAGGHYTNQPVLLKLTSDSRWKFGMTGGGLINTFNGTSVKSGWPQPGTSIGGGWEVAPGVGPDGKPNSFMLDATSPIGWLRPFTYNISYIGPPPVDPPTDPNAPPPPQTDFDVFINHGMWNWSFALNAYHIRMAVHYQADRKRTETVRAVMVADVMEVSDNTGNDTEEIAYTSENVAEGVDPEGGIPIGMPEFRSYFQSDRGAASFEYLLLAARAKLRARARSVEITFAVKWTDAIGLGIDLRKSVAYTDRRIPGGAATGKVKHYRLIAGEGGMYGEFTLGCSIGNGQPVTAEDGVNVYADPGYVDDGWQVEDGDQYMFLTDELAYQTLDQFEIVDDGLDLTHLTAEAVVNSCTVVNGLTVQLAELAKFHNVSMPIAGLSNPFNATKNLATTVTLDLKPVAGSEYHTDFLPAVSMLAIPQTIDLRAA